MAEVPRGPVETPPPGFAPQAEQARILAGVLAGIELGAWDRRIVEWLAGWDTCTALTVASLIARARAAGQLGAGDDRAGRVEPGASSQDH
jgi:hypothetical protein